MKTTHITSLGSFALAILLGVASSPAALINSYLASDPSNTGSTWNDGTGSLDLTLADVSLAGSFSSANTDFTASYALNGSAGSASGAINDTGLADALPSASMEIWFRSDLSTTGNTPQMLFESGGGQNGFSLFIQSNGNGGSELRAINSAFTTLLNDFTLDLAGFDDSDFIQVVLTLDDGPNLVSLYANATAGGATASTSSSGGNWNSSSGGNATGIYNYAGGSGLGSDAGSTVNAGGNVSQGIGTIATFDGEIALLNMYNTALTGSEVTDAFNLHYVPEPTAASFLLGGSLLLCWRRRNGSRPA